MGHAKLESTMKYYVGTDMDQKKAAVKLLSAQTG